MELDIEKMKTVTADEIRTRRRMDRLRGEIRAALSLQASKIADNSRALGLSEEDTKSIVAQLLDIRERKELMVL